MPIYEYRCEECNERFELFVRSGVKPEDLVCPVCGSSRVVKVISLFGVQSGTGREAADSCMPTSG